MNSAKDSLSCAGIIRLFFIFSFIATLFFFSSKEKYFVSLLVINILDLVSLLFIFPLSFCVNNDFYFNNAVPLSASLRILHIRSRKLFIFLFQYRRLLLKQIAVTKQKRERERPKTMNSFNVFLLSFCFLFARDVLGSKDTTVLDDILISGINSHVFPGVVAVAGDSSGKVFYSKSFGNYEYLDEHPSSPNVTMSSLYDIASVTKVLATTSAIGLLYQRGYLRLDDKIHDLLKDTKYRDSGGKENVTVLNCLLHNAGYHADPLPGFYDSAFGCPNEFKREDFSCLDRVYKDIIFENLTTTPGSSYLYSDLSFLTLQMVVGALSFYHKLIPVRELRRECFENINSGSRAELDLNKGLIFTCYFEAFVRKNIFEEDSHWLESTTFRPPQSKASQCIPTMDTSATKVIRQGIVSDSNCYAMGGICGHAGVFTSAPDVAKLLQRFAVLSSSSSSDPIAPYGNWLNVTTVKLFTTEYNQSQSSRALGWTTNDPEVKKHDLPTNSLV
jgi:CubicO group peptidase (beta-lactamase class C family)